MIFLSILILIVAVALPSIKEQLTPVIFTRVTSITFIYALSISLNALYIQSIGSGIGLYSGLFHITLLSQFFDLFLVGMASIILLGWPVALIYPEQHYPKRTSPTEYENSEIYRGKCFPIENRNKTLVIKEGIGFEFSRLIDRTEYPIEYCLIILFTSLGASFLVSSADFISMYLSIELQSFGVYILSTIYRDSEDSSSAGLKYFLLGALSSCFILLGAGIVYSYTGLTNFESIYSIISVSNNIGLIQGISLGLILIFIGFLFKIGAAPLHNWSPDVYDDTPNIVTTWISIMPKISILILLLELYSQIYTPTGNNGLLLESGESILLSVNTNSNLVYTTSDLINNINNVSILGHSTFSYLKILLLISSLISLVIGTVLGLSQVRIKRLLAYSTISHLGFILLALAINTEQSIESFIFYIIQYSLTNLNTFLILLAIGYVIQANWTESTRTYFSQYKDCETDLKYINELKGYFFANPLLSLSLSICFFSMAGIPPLIGFFSKQFVLYSAIESGYYFMSLLGIFVSIISASYYLKIVNLLHLETKSIKEIEVFTRTDAFPVGSVTGPLNDCYNPYAPLGKVHSFVISVLTLTILLFVLKPSLLLNSTQVLSLSLFNF